MDLPASLGKYPITGILGKGAMGVVYRGYDPLIRRPVAIKTILKELFEGELDSGEVAARFRKEAQAAGALSHPGIVGVYEYGETEDYAYIAMECVDGSSLREYFNRGVKFPESDVVSMMSQLLDALEFAHTNAVVHRDVKPANIIIMKNGRVKLADFGIARLQSADRTLTTVNMIMGTPGYIAPEYYLNDPIDHRVDVYAAGVVFYELLSGRVPFGGPPEAVMRAVCYDEPPPPSTLDPERRWPQYDSIVAHALRKRAENRFPSAGAFRSALLSEYKHPAPDTIATTAVYARELDVQPALPPTPPPTGWDAAVLAHVKTELAQFLGPLARVLVQRTAGQCPDLETLADRLGRKIESAEDRALFTRRVLEQDFPRQPTAGSRGSAAAAPAPGGNSVPGGRSVPPAPSAAEARPATGGKTGGAGSVTAEEIEDLVRRLTLHIGPIARVVVRRIQGEGLGRTELYTKAAQAIENGPVRRRFLQELGITG